MRYGQTVVAHLNEVCTVVGQLDVDVGRLCILANEMDYSGIPEHFQ